jgi:hypothetical protein
MKLLIISLLFLFADRAFAQFTPRVQEPGNKAIALKKVSNYNEFSRTAGYKFQFLEVDQISFWTSDQPFVYLGQTDHLPGFFCKMEYKLESYSKLAPRFRLGSLNYTEWMEGKGEWYDRYK